MKILIIRLSSMGDVILVTPLLSALRNKHPGSSITLVTGRDYAQLFTDDSRVSRVISVAQDGSADSIPGCAGGWDLVVDLQNSPKSRALLRRLGVSGSVRRFDKLHVQRLMLLCLRIDTYRTSGNVASRYINAACGKEAPQEVPPARLLFSAESCTRARTMFELEVGDIVRPSIALFPFSAWKNKEWPEEHFAAVGRYFLVKGWNVAIMGGPADAARAGKMKSDIGGRCVSLAGKFTLYECGSLLSTFSLALGNDTGLAHLARACGVKTGVLFGPTVRQFGFYPYAAPAFRIFEERLACRPCHAHGGNGCLRMNRRCLRAIGPKQVIRGMEELFHAAGE